MLVLRGVRGELDDRCGLLEYLATPVEHEVVVRGDEGEGNGEWCAKTVKRDLMPFPPR